MKRISTMFPEARGFALPAAIFILVVLGGLGAFAASLSTLQHTGAALDVQGIRAYQAARAGLEWGMYQSVKGLAGCVTGSSKISEVSLDAATLQGLTLTVQCEDVSVAGSGVNLSRVTAWACNPGLAATPKCPGNAAVDGYVERKLIAIVER